MIESHDWITWLTLYFVRPSLSLVRFGQLLRYADKWKSGGFEHKRLRSRTTHGFAFCFGQPITLLHYADKRIVNTMKVYIERNNLQLELIRYGKTNLILFTFSFAKIGLNAILPTERTSESFEITQFRPHFWQSRPTRGTSQCTASHIKSLLQKRNASVGWSLGGSWRADKFLFIHCVNDNIQAMCDCEIDSWNTHRMYWHKYITKPRWVLTSETHLDNVLLQADWTVTNAINHRTYKMRKHQNVHSLNNS